MRHFHLNNSGVTIQLLEKPAARPDVYTACTRRLQTWRSNMVPLYCGITLFLSRARRVMFRGGGFSSFFIFFFSTIEPQDFSKLV